jgi:CheY-like chemotaxis protein
MTILIVDDDADIRHLLATFLTFKGYATLSAANGHEALLQLQLLHVPPSLIVLDHMMPVMDGIAFRQVQCQDPRLAMIPVVVLSAVDTFQPPQMPAEAYLRKPIDFDALLPLVEQYCAQSHEAL